MPLFTLLDPGLVTTPQTISQDNTVPIAIVMGGVVLIALILSVLACSVMTMRKRDIGGILMSDLANSSKENQYSTGG